MTVELRIGPEVIQLLQATCLHSFGTAFAEFVDNSTHQSYFNHKDELDEEYEKDADQLTITIEYNKAKGRIRILDNAMGMSLDELKKCSPGRPPAGRYVWTIKIRNGNENRGVLAGEYLARSDEETWRDR